MDDADVIQVIGRFGIYHGMMILLALMRAYPVAWTNMMSPLMAADVPHWCSAPNSTINATWWKDNGIPKSSDGTLEQCSMFGWTVEDGINFNKSEECSNGWTYDKEQFGETATSEWDLVCRDAWKKSAMQSIIMAGSFAGVVVFGKMSDQIGRKRVFVICLVVVFVAALPAAFARTFLTFNALRFIQSSATAGMTTAIVTMTVEIMPVRDRIFMNVGFGMGYAIPVLLIPALSYCLSNFRHMQLAIGLSGIVLIPFLFVIYESPKWLLAKHHVNETERVIIGILRRNRRPIPNMYSIMPALMARAETETAAESKNLVVTDILKDETLRRNAALIAVTCFTWSVKGYYLHLNAHRLPGNAHLNFAISTLSEFPAGLIGMYLIRNCGRRPSQMVSVFISAVLFCILFFVDDKHSNVKVWGMMVVRLFLSLFGYIKWLAVHEIHPTPVRSAGFALSMMFSRIGAMLAPFVKDLSTWIHHALPVYIFVLFTFADLWCLSKLPETLDQPLPDTIEDVRRLPKSSKSSR
ncbi:solute carrier family 22 member 6-like [Galendromus occidentalis]|uniref:Solute carrier family 22 member 6-like n=1 Tax=Galendromus occidentalis TaxID=34638 RepID=A0AAJ7L5Z0_9ACAR|nr:solute carrier family 22 member 6-like [Galendromus occidentalis]